MVRLSKQQEELIKELNAARVTLNKAVAEAEAELRVRRTAARKPVAELVARALEAGIPARQVAVRGLGYADVASLKQFQEPARPTQLPDSYEDAILGALSQPAKQEARAYWSDTNDEEWEWWMIDAIDADGTNLGAMVDVDRSLIEKNGVVEVDPGNGWIHYKGQTREAVREAINSFLSEQYPDKPIRWA